MRAGAHAAACTSLTAVRWLAQDSTTSGANVKKLEAESAAAVKDIEKSIAAKKKEVRCVALCPAPTDSHTLTLLQNAVCLHAACLLAPPPLWLGLCHVLACTSACRPRLKVW
jgi:uncharacterized UBP type Zn finger protein